MLPAASGCQANNELRFKVFGKVQFVVALGRRE